MTKYLTIAVLLLISLMVTTHAQDDRQQDNPNFKLQNFVQDVRNVTFDGVPLADLQNLRISCPAMRDAVDLYQRHVVSHFITRTSSSCSHLSVADDIAIMGLGRTKAQTDAAIHNAITKYLTENLFISVEMGCPLSPYLLIHPNLQQVNISDFGNYPTVFEQMRLMYAQIFKESIPTEEATQRYALDAFAAVFPVKDVYFSKEKLEENILDYIKTVSSFQESYGTLLTDAPFDKTSHIVISFTQLYNMHDKPKLQSILAANPNHTVVFTLGNSTNPFDEQDRFYSSHMTNFVQSMNIKYLQFTNPRGNVKVIGDNFLSYSHALISVDFRGLTSLQSIGPDFLRDCDALTSVNFRGLTNLQSIGSFFLGYCPRLISIDLRGLMSLQSIGQCFFIDCDALISIDLRGLTNLQSIEPYHIGSCDEIIVGNNKKFKERFADMSEKQSGFS